MRVRVREDRKERDFEAGGQEVVIKDGYIPVSAGIAKKDLSLVNIKLK